jgi:hypothetical protein
MLAARYAGFNRDVPHPAFVCASGHQFVEAFSGGGESAV